MISSLGEKLTLLEIILAYVYLSVHFDTLLCLAIDF